MRLIYDIFNKITCVFLYLTIMHNWHTFCRFNKVILCVYIDNTERS